MTDSVSPGGHPADPPRRDFLASFLACLFGGLVAIFPFFAGVFAFLDPISRQRRVPQKFAGPSAAGPSEFQRVCALSALPEGGSPQRFAVIANQTDAWNYSPGQPIGAVFVQRVDANGVRVFQTTCPHAGCSIALEGDVYNCPCHNSSFNLDGSKRVSSSGRENPSPRDMDRLEIDAQQLEQGEVWVRFQNFYTGREQQVAKL